mmetsp:Transcript_31997/g.73260  ORF Transcript_31997/g.73260 Transcript_31997/m.73260 type:complete len:228 (-) Transcript_31997:441-1124(-)
MVRDVTNVQVAHVSCGQPHLPAWYFRRWKVLRQHRLAAKVPGAFRVHPDQHHHQRLCRSRHGATLSVGVRHRPERIGPEAFFSGEPDQSRHACDDVHEGWDVVRWLVLEHQQHVLPCAAFSAVARPYSRLRRDHGASLSQAHGHCWLHLLLALPHPRTVRARCGARLWADGARIDDSMRKPFVVCHASRRCNDHLGALACSRWYAFPPVVYDAYKCYRIGADGNRAA